MLIPRPIAFVLVLTSCMFPVLASSVLAQAHHDPLTEKETDKLAELADQPDERVKFYTGLINERTTSIQQLTIRAKDPDRTRRLRNLFEEFTFLLDELSDNLDHYSDIHADIRKPLKVLIPTSEKWPELLNQFPADPGYDFPRKSALDAANDIHAAATKLLPELETYIAAQKAEEKAKRKAADHR